MQLSQLLRVRVAIHIELAHLEAIFVNVLKVVKSSVPALAKVKHVLVH